MSCWIYWLAARQAGLLLWSKGDVNFMNNGAGHFSLHDQGILQVALIALGPELGIRRPVNQPRRDEGQTAGARHGALYDCVHFQLARDFSKRPPRGLKLHYRSPRNYANGLDL